jgi:beta-glucuronidase
MSYSRWLLTFVLLIGCCVAETNVSPLIQNAEQRRVTSLNGPWHVIVDPYDNGYYDYRLQPRRDGYFRNAKPSSPADLIEYSFDESPTLNVPGDWNSQRSDLFFYEGTLWYERTFEYHRAPYTRLFLYIGAANYLSRVYVNGEAICEHEGGFTSFDCEITGHVHDGANFVVIYVNNQRRRDAVPTVNTDWWNYGGLTRDVMLVETPRLFIRDYFLHLAPGSTNQISGWLQLDGDMQQEAAQQTGTRQPTGKQKIRLRIPELNLDQTFTTEQNGRATVWINAPNLHLWSPQDPKLYEIEISSASGSGRSDSLKDSIGFRSVEARGHDILLNGKPVFLRGVSIHEEAPYRSGRAFSEQDARTLLGWVRELHGNFARLAHYPHNQHMPRLADRLGVMLWSEIPVYWTIDWSNPATLDNARRQLAEMIDRDKNRASIVLWSVGNETPVSDERMRFMISLVKAARAQDPTRLLTAALETRTVKNTKTIDDPLGAQLDVLGVNEYIGWYEGAPDLADRMEWESSHDKPLVISEFGGDAKFGLHGPPSQRWTEEYQDNIYIHQLCMLERIPFLRGMSPWILMDFRSPRRVLPHVQDYYNRKGLVSEKGEKKKAWFTLQKFYREKGEQASPTAALAAGCPKQR